MEEGSRPQQFFRREETRNAIELLASRDRVTIVVGAGASAEVGLPLWSELVERLLLRALSPGTPAESLDYPEGVQIAARQALAEGGAVGAATMARAVLGDRFDSELRRCLYEWPHQWQWDRPGATAHAVARLFRVMSSQGKTCEIATTNYDVKLEKALEEALGDPIKPSCTDSEDPDGIMVVRHLHGVLTEDGKSQEVTLTEADYHSVNANLPWQESYLRRRLDDSTVVFIGASLTDQHMLRYIFRYASEERPPIALLVEKLEGDGEVDKHHSPDQADHCLETLKRERWDYAHLVALQADFRSQPAQFLHEVAHHKESEDAVRYGERLDRWYRAVSSERFGLASGESFRLSQFALQEIVEDWLDAVVETFESAGYDLSDETLAVHLWCRCPERLGTDVDGRRLGPLSSLAMLGCSDRTWNDPRALDVRLITQPSSRAAVDAFCWGTPQVQFPQGPRPKWHWILATPVVLEDDSVYGRLPVGAVTLVSDCSMSKSVLRKVGEDDRGHELLSDIERFLAEVAEGALAPSDSD